MLKKSKRGFSEHRTLMQWKLAMEISSIKTLELIQNGHGNFQVQKLREVIQTTMENFQGQHFNAVNRQ